MKMRGVLLPGGRRVEFAEFDVPEPGHGQVLIKMKASSICGSDIRAIYREHLGHGPEAYQGVIGGHEPCGQIAAVGPGCKRFQVGDRVILYHISGCGVCNDCREGYMISCTSDQRAAYGWQRDGGHADYCLAEESTCVALPEPLTEREQEVLALLAQGKTNREIAEQLVVTERTAKFHVSSILGKLGAGNRTEAVVLAQERGLVK